MYFTAPESNATLVEFYNTVRPGGSWRPIAWKVDEDPNITTPSTLKLLGQWLLGIAIVYAALFGVGYLLLG
jgi:hypothetical protein